MTNDLHRINNIRVYKTLCDQFLYAITKKSLFAFVGDENEQSTQDIQFSSLDCIKLVDWSDRIIREDKRGAILSQRSRLLSSFGLDDDT